MLTVVCIESLWLPYLSFACTQYVTNASLPPESFFLKCFFVYFILNMTTSLSMSYLSRYTNLCEMVFVEDGDCRFALLQAFDLKIKNM